MNASNFLTAPDTHPLALHVLCLRRFGTEYLAWEPITIWEELTRNYGKAPSGLNKAKINACRTVHATTAPYEDWFIFEKVVLAFGYVMPQFNLLQKPSAAVTAHGVGVMQQLRARHYSADIEKFISGLLLAEGFTNPPRQLKFLGRRIKEVVSSELFTKVERLLSGNDHSLPKDAVLAAQVLRHRDLQNQLREYKRLQDEHLAIANQIVAA
jgi:hypothetical protein